MKVRTGEIHLVHSQNVSILKTKLNFKSDFEILLRSDTTEMIMNHFSFVSSLSLSTYTKVYLSHENMFQSLPGTYS